MRWTLIELLGLNALLLAIAFHGVYGAILMWQPGANPPQYAPLLGVQSYLQSLKEKGYNATIVYGFLSYSIEYWKGGSRVTGIPIFDWAQFSLLLLAVSDILVLIYFLRRRKVTKSP